MHGQRATMTVRTVIRRFTCIRNPSFRRVKHAPRHTAISHQPALTSVFPLASAVLSEICFFGVPFWHQSWQTFNYGSSLTTHNFGRFQGQRSSSMHSQSVLLSKSNTSLVFFPSRMTRAVLLTVNHS